MNKRDFRDWFVVVFIVAFAVTATIYLFKHPSDVAYGVWAGLLTPTGAMFHWICVQDDKTPDVN